MFLPAKARNAGGKEAKRQLFFVDLLGMGCDKELITVLRAYFDESERPSGIFCVAGFAFQKRAARMFTKDWTELFPDGAHMVDLLARRKQFKNITEKERDNLVRKAVPIIKKHMEAGVVASCNVHEVRALTPRWICGYGDAYPVCVHVAMFALGDWLREKNSPERVSYVFEAGHKFAAEAHRHMSHVVQAPEMREAYRYHAHAFLPKTDAIPLQAADFLSWEWTKFRDETLEQRIRRPRGSLIALLGNEDKSFNEKKFAGVHISGPSLAKFLSQVTQMGVEQLKEERQERALRKKWG